MDVETTENGTKSEQDDESKSTVELATLTRLPSAAQVLESIATNVKTLITPPRQEDVYPWMNVVLIAVTVGTIEYLPAAALAWTIPQKYDFLDWVINNYGVGIMTVVNIALCVACVVASVLITSLVPAASGSGIPPLIAYLFNGKMTNKYLLSVRMVIVKMIGVVLAISGGLAIGREGPAIHIGAAVGDLTNRLINKTIRLVTGKKIKFDGGVKCNVVMMGATAGFASAFRSPVGGLMYCVEEIASHWDIKSHMTTGAQTFLAAAVAAFVTDFIIRLTNDNNTIQFSSIIIFDGTDVALFEGAIYTYLDLPGFLAIAIVCGALAGYTTKASNYLRAWRYQTAYRQQLWVVVRDAVLVAGLTALVFSMESLLYEHCKGVPEDDQDDGHRRLSGGGGERQ
jgi:H+/Cl- antiporter ClcA